MFEPAVKSHLSKDMSKERFDLNDAITKKLLDSRIVLFAGDVHLTDAELPLKHLLYLGTENDKPVRVILNSPGGEVYVGLLIFDTIKDLVNKGIDVTVEVRGLAASMGAIILQAGTHRVASKYSRLLIHEVSSISWGKASEQEDEVKELRIVNDSMAQIIAERCGKTVEDINKIWTKKDVWMSAQEAKDFGLIDEVI